MSMRVRSMTSSLVWRVCVLLFAALLLSTPIASAANDTAQNAVILTATSNSASETLVGSPGGAYRYYQFRYQGSSAPVLVSLTFQPGYGSTGNQAFGFNIYGPNGLSFAGTSAGNNGNSSTAQYTVANPAAMNLLVQVYNYTAGMSVSYTLTVYGLSGGSGAGIVAKNNTTPGSALNVSTINATLGGTLVGKSNGAFQYYTLHYPGGNSPLTVTMNVTPVYTGQQLAYGFNLYRADPANGNTVLAATAVPVAQDTNSITLSATVTNPSASSYELQVVNYWPGVSITYGINATGLAGPTTPASGNLDAAHAIVLNSARQGATETLVGDRGGAFNYFLVNYPGNQSQLAISVTYRNLNGATTDQLGFKVYNGSTLVATVNPMDDGNGLFSASWPYQDPDAATFGIQVFNYAQGVSMPYTIYEVGSQ